MSAALAARTRGRAAAIAAPLALGAIAVVGCGSSESFPPAAEPPVAPPPSRSPGGHVVAVGAEPEGLVADPRTGIVAVGLRNPDQLALLDGSSGRVLRRVGLDESPRHLALARPGGPVLVPAERAGELIEVGLPGGRTRSVPVGEFPHDAVAVDGRVFVGNEIGDTISVLERKGVVRTLDAPVQPGGLAASPDGKVVVVAVAERVLGVYDAATLEAEGTVTGGVGPTHVVSDCRRRIYVADTEGEAVLAYRFDGELRFVDRFNVDGAPYGLAVDCRRRLLWVTLPGENRLLELRIPGAVGTVRARHEHPTVRQPNTVATNAATGRVYVASRTDGTVQILDPRQGGR